MRETPSEVCSHGPQGPGRPWAPALGGRRWGCLVLAPQKGHQRHGQGHWPLQHCWGGTGDGAGTCRRGAQAGLPGRGEGQGTGRGAMRCFLTTVRRGDGALQGMGGGPCPGNPASPPGGPQCTQPPRTPPPGPPECWAGVLGPQREPHCRSPGAAEGFVYTPPSS